MKGVVDELANLLKQRFCASHDEARPKVAYCKSVFAAERSGLMVASWKWSRSSGLVDVPCVNL